MTRLNFSKIPYGGDWNPEQWDREVWEQDVRLFREAGIDLLSINIFAWTLDQPDEDTYHFGWLDDVIALLKRNDMRVCLGTGTAAHPAWMATKYPDILHTDFQGRRRKFGDRHNSCPSSPTYRRYAPRMARTLAEHYRHEDAVALWHISNEFGGACYCERCEQRFRTWLQQRYGTLDALNRAWNASFWSQTITDWDQIVAPNVLTVQWGERNTAVQGLTLDYLRFNSDNLLDAYRLEYDQIREVLPDAVITTNLMGTYRPLDYRRWAPHLDIAAWDSYPAPGAAAAHTALRHSLTRGLRHGQPFMLMEQTPSQTNWQPYNALKRPGVMRLQSWQAVAHGADAVMFFQMRRSVGAAEKFHGAVIEHHGRSDTRVFQEVAALGAELKRLGNQTLGSRVPAQVALWFDWESWWGAENSMGPSAALNYTEELDRYYAAFHAANIPVDLIGLDADLSGYRVVLAPLLYIVQDGVAEQLTRFVEGGGTLVTSFLSGVADISDRVFPGGPPGPLRELLGLWVEEIDALAPDVHNEIVITAPLGPLQGRYTCSLLFDQLRVEDAEVLGTYGSDFYAGRAALTRKRTGRGSAWRVASSPEPRFLQDLARYVSAEAGVEPVLPDLPAGVEATRREQEDRRVLFVLNHNASAVTVPLDDIPRRDLLSGEALAGPVTLPPYGVLVAREG